MDPLDKLTKALARLPGVGRRSAERMALRLLRDREGLLRDLVSALQTAGESILCCSLCGNVTPVDEDPCRLCSDSGRDDHVLCVVENPDDILTIEKSGGYRGRYHALMGKLSPMRGDGPADLRIRSLLERLDQGQFSEVILALSTDGEGEATAGFIVDALKDRKTKVTRLALGLPAGSAVMYSDSVTLTRALRGRQPV